MLKGRTEGRAEAMRETFLAVTQARFPKLSKLAQELLAKATDPNILQELTVKISQADNEDEARGILLKASEQSADKH